MDAIDQGLASVNESGEAQELHDKWQHPLNPQTFSQNTVLLLIVLIASPLLVVLAVLAVRFRRLRKKAVQSAQALEETRKRYATVTATTRDAVIASDSESKIILFNPGAEKLFGYGEKEVLGEPLSMLCPPDMVAEHEQILRDLHDKGFLQGIETEVQNSAGERVLVEVTLSISTGQAGQPESVNALMRDITERKRSAEKVERNLVVLRTLLEVLQYRYDNRQDFLDHALRKAIELTRSKLGYIYCFDEDANSFSLCSWLFIADESSAPHNPPPALDLDNFGIWGERLGRQNPLILNGVDQNDIEGRLWPGIQVKLNRFLLIPVCQNEALTAVVGVGNKDGLYDEEDQLELSLMVNSLWKSVSVMDNEQVLLDSERYLRTILHTTPDGFFVIDLQGIVRDVNAAYCAMSGYGPAELIGMHIRQLDPRETPDETDARMQRIIEKGSETFEARHRRKDGSLYPVELSAAYMEEDGGQFVCFCRDLTERQQASEALIRSEWEYRLLAESPNTIVAKFDDEGCITFVNKYAADLFGYAIEEMMGKNALDLIFAETDSKGRKNSKFWEDLLKNPHNYRFQENENITKDGKTLWISWTNTPIFDEDGRMVELICTGFDATSRVQAENKMRESEKRFRAVVEHINAAIFVVQDRKYVYSNLAGGQLLGLPPGKVFGRSIADFLSPADLDWIDKRHQMRLQGQAVNDIIEHELVTADGRTKWIQTTGTIINWRDTPSTLAFAVDISAQKKAEADRERLESQLRQAQKMEALGTLAGGIAHDFNNILAAIIGYAELALDEAESGSIDIMAIDQVIQAGNRARELVTQILSFSRKIEPELKPIKLNNVVLEAESMLRRTIPRMIDIELNLDADLWNINADSNQLHQVLMNLGSNAVDAMPDGGSLAIETCKTHLDDEYTKLQAGVPPGKYVLLTVSDTGQGMDKKTMEHIFDPFFTNKAVGKGTGLGLATVYGIVQNHAGFILCYSEPGRGTTFKIYLPAIKSEDELSALTEGDADQVSTGDETVLLVDDEESLREMGSRILARSGYRVLVADTGEAALEIYRDQGTEGIDVVILDISMPGMGGHKCLLEILKINPRARVIIASGYSMNGKLRDIVNSGAAGFLAKPFGRNQMLSTVRRVLDA